MIVFSYTVTLIMLHTKLLFIVYKFWLQFWMILWFWLVFLVFPLLLFLHPLTTPPTCPYLNRFLLLSIPFHFIYSLFFFPPCPRFKWHLLFFNASITFLGTEAETGNAAGIASPDLQPLGQDDSDEGGNHGFFVDLRLWIFFIFPSLLLTATSLQVSTASGRGALSGLLRNRLLFHQKIS